MPRHRLYEDPLVNMTVRLPEDVLDQLRDIARQNGVAYADVVRVTLLELVETCRRRTGR